MARQGTETLLIEALQSAALQGMAMIGIDWTGPTGSGIASQGLARHGTPLILLYRPRRDMARPGEAETGAAMLCLAKHGELRHLAGALNIDRGKK
jgi:hypothetical protein